MQLKKKAQGPFLSNTMLVIFLMIALAIILTIIIMNLLSKGLR